MDFKNILRERLHRDLGFDFYRKDKVSIRRFRIIAKEPGILCGTLFVPTIVRLVDEEFFLDTLEDNGWFKFIFPKEDGETIGAGEIIGTIDGNAEVLLKAERTICDILSRLSGIATKTREEMVKVSDSGLILLDTRKDDPLMRPFHQYAVRIGGGKNHRFGLFDGVLIKDNDIAVYGGIQRAIDVRIAERRHLTRLEVEVKTLAELDEVLKDGRVDAILLDNMNPEMIEEAMRRIGKASREYLVEASGIGKESLGEIAKTGVTFVSTSALVRKAPYVDISMKVV